MNNIAEHTPVAAPAGKKKFKGYSLNELRYRMMVNDLKIQFAKSSLAAEMASEKRREESNMLGLWMSLDTWLTYGQVALFSYRTAKRYSPYFTGSKRNVKFA